MEKEQAVTVEKRTSRTPWNKGKIIGAKPPLRLNLVDPNEASHAGQDPQSSPLQPGDRW